MPVLLLFTLILSIPLWGYWIRLGKRVSPVLAGWMLAISFILVIFLWVRAEPPLLMLLYISSTFLSMKIVVAYNHLGTGAQLNFRQWILFCYGWFGMNPRPFLSFPSSPLPDYGSHIKKGLLRALTGVVVINAGFLVEKSTVSFPVFVPSLFYLVGLSLVLHFGVLNIFTGGLRRLGVPVTSLFKDPIRSKTLNEFWSRRWNLAFVELTTIAVLRPATVRFGKKAAFWLSFIFSGLLHELAISLPVMSGFGMPFTYFIIQALLILTLDAWVIKKLPGQWMRATLILACLFLPIFLLFHEAFIEGVIRPIVGYLRFV